MTMLIDHVNINVAESDLETVVAFYVAALAPLGCKELMRFPKQCGTGSAVGLGAEKPNFWVASQPEKPNTTTHIAFSSDDHATVEAFHAAALKAGAKDNGAPGLRTHYHPDYFGAFVLDPVGNNLEVVCQKKL